jgi:hypothetical protein
MTATFNANPWIHAALGAVGAVAVQQFGQAAWTSGWLAAATAGILAAGAGCVLAAGMLRGRQGSSDAPPAPGWMDWQDPSWDQALRGADWLSRNGAFAVPDRELEGVLRARLTGCLVPLPPKAPSGWEFDLPEPVALLALALSVRTRSGSLWEEGAHGSTCRAILDGLARAQALGSPEDRRNAYAEIRAGIGPDALKGMSKVYAKVAEAHGTLPTFLMGLLAMARSRGDVLAAGEFAWLKGVDRGLWYALDGLGRLAFHAEGLAAMDHYLHEVATNLPASAPFVEGAVATLAAFRRDPFRCPGDPVETERRDAWA